MTRPAFFIDVRQQGTDLERDIRSGGLFVQGVQHPLNQHCEVTFRFDDVDQRVDARVVFADVQGIGLELFVMPPERAALAERIRLERSAAPQGGRPGEPARPPAPAPIAPDDDDPASDWDLPPPVRHARSSSQQLATAPVASAAQRGSGADGPGAPGDDGFDELGADGPGAPGDDGFDELGEDRELDQPEDEGDRAAVGSGRARQYLPVHERMRNLSVAEQLRLAHRGEQQERVLLERLYGKIVWEALLRNPRITAPEVARIARMGALPKPLLELIVNNASWLQVPEIRRALLGNLRLAVEMIPRVLRLLPRHELKLVPAQTAYPAAVRDVARRMLRE